MQSFGFSFRYGWLLAGVLLFSGGAFPLGAAESASEVRALREELVRAKQEIERLRAENEALRRGAPLPPATAIAPAPASAAPPAASVLTPAPAAPAVAAAAPAAAVVTLPAPVEHGTLVEAEQLLADYRASEVGGDARYRGRKLRVRGKVHDFKKAFVGLGWTIRMQGADRLGLIRFQTSFPGISDFRPAANNRLLEGRRPFAPWQVLLEQGGTIVLEGVCEGVDDAVIQFKDARPVKD